jgi:flagellar biosynthetic protein FliQ
MNDAAIIDIALSTMLLTGKIVGPMLGISLVIGFTVSLMQSVTQIQEFTLTFVPKFVSMGIVLLVGGPWMLSQLISFVNDLFDKIPSLLA